MFSTEVEVTFGEVKVILGFAKVLSTCTLCLRRGVAVDPTSVEGLLSIFKKEKKAWSNKNLEVAETRFSLLFLCTKYREIAKPSRFEHTLFSDCKFLLMSHFFSRKVETGFFSTFLVLKKTLSPLFCKKGAVKREGGKNVRNGPSFSLFFLLKKVRALVALLGENRVFCLAFLFLPLELLNCLNACLLSCAGFKNKTESLDFLGAASKKKDAEGYCICFKIAL